MTPANRSPSLRPAPYATHPAESRGRLRPEPESRTRTPFQRDRDRIIHSTAFRRLKHKTQVFVYHEGDHYRTRLTHSIEVAQITRSLCRCLGLDEDLGEALALAHDLGHTPFGHAGEEALDAAMRHFGGFDHNAQTLRIVTRLERRYAEFDGLNLTWETLEGIVKHNGPLTGAIPAAVSEYVRGHDLELDTHAGLEAQVAALADDIAYTNHDIDDGLRAGLFDIADLAPLPLVGEVFAEVRGRYPSIERPRFIHESIRRLIDRMILDVIATTEERLAAAAPGSAVEVRRHGAPLAAFSSEMEGSNRSLKQFLLRRMYRHERVTRMTDEARQVVKDLFQMYMDEPGRLPPEWRALAEGEGGEGLPRLVSDYIAGMTDRYALDEHARRFGERRMKHECV